MSPRWTRGLLVGAVLVLAAFVALSDPAVAAGEEVRIPDRFEHVVLGESALINVTFGVNESQETLIVDCGDPCSTTWERTVEFRESKRNCHTTDAFVTTEGEFQESRRVCEVSFPTGFQRRDGQGPSPSEAGEPAHATDYDVRIQVTDDEGEGGSEDTFNAHLSSGATCRPQTGPNTRAEGVVRRGEIMLIAASGFPQGWEITLEVRDGTETFFERQVTSQGQSISYFFRWRIGLNFPLQGAERQVEVSVQGVPPSGDASSGRSELESVLVRPGVAVPFPVREPGQRAQDFDFNRTQDVQVWTTYVFTAAPRDCREVSFDRRLIPLEGDQISTPPTAKVRRLSAPPAPNNQTVDTQQAAFNPDTSTFLVNYTIPRDEQATDEDTTSPVYDLQYERTRLADDNFIGRYNSTNYEVHPYDIVPEFEVLQPEVERLETARLVMNLTYADGSPFTPEDASGDLNVEFGLEEEHPQFTFEANHREAGLWNVSKPLGFEYEPLGAYTWRVQELEDTHGGSDKHNRIQATVTDIVNVVSARPRIQLASIVDGEAVNGTQRTKQVSVRVHAQFQNGVPLTGDNVDPSLGGLVLNVDKRNQFDRLVDRETFTMVEAGQPGTWVQSFRVGRSPSSSPAGQWDLEVVARDDRSPPNENVTQFPFDVRPANITASITKAPPQLVNGSEIELEFRLSYPDGSIASERLVDESRGGDLEVRLERVTRAGQDAIVEERVTPTPISGGQAWRVELDSSKVVPGTHFFNITGEDIHGNPIGPDSSDIFSVLFNGEFRNSTTPICPAQNGSQPETCTKERGETVYVVFPGASGDKGLTDENPDIRVHRRDPQTGRWVLFREDVWLSPERFFNLTGRDIGVNHAGRFVTDESTPAQEYRLVILGRQEDDTGFAGFSQTFDVERVPVTREILDPFPDSAQKTQEISAQIASQPGDVIDSAVAQAGSVSIRNIETDTISQGTFLTWQPPRTLPTGPASIEIQGRDLFGNPFQVSLGPIELEPVEIQVTQDSEIPDSAQRGQPATFDVRMRYETGTPFTSGEGEPSVVVQAPDGTQVDTGDAVFRTDHWQIIWQPRADLPPGEYQVVVTGSDDSGNVVRDFKTDPIRVTPGTIDAQTPSEPPNTVVRGQAATAQLSFPVGIENGSAVVTTGSSPIGEAQMRIDGGTVSLRFPTDRTTELVDAFFQFSGTDEVGNNLTGRTQRFSVRPQQMQIEWLAQPPEEATIDQTVEGAFTIRYPDGTRMRPGQGTAIVGLFARDQPLGSLEATPLEENPTVWKVTWDPPSDVRTDIPYRFSASARDTFRNEAPPVSSNGFFVTNPVVPEYVPAPGPGPWIALVSMAGVALALQGRRWQDDLD